MLPQEFVNKWRGNTSNERQVYQQHFLDLCALVGHGTPAALDPESNFFTFEAGAAKSGGGAGWADVWFKGHFAIEYKGRNKSLDAAYTQLLQYRESLENPPLLVTSNTQEVHIHTNFTNSTKRVEKVTLDDLLKPEGIQHIRNLFYNVAAFRPQQTAAQVTEEAAARFGELAEHLRKWGHASDAIAHYLIRVLFCLFAEDIDLLPQAIFTRLIDAGRSQPRRFTAQVTQLFAVMAEGGYFGEHTLRYFDGGLFDGAPVIDMDADAIKILHRISTLDWSSIEPSILGTLFTRSLDPSQRAKLGAQYTSKDDIVLIVEPVLMAPLRREWAAVQAEARTLAQTRDAAITGKVRTAAHTALEKLIEAFAQKLATWRILDPACGSGNFLYVALHLLLDLWKEIAIFAAEVGLTLLTPYLGFAPSPAQLYGIEINEYAHELAQATVWIGYLKWLHDNGYGTPSDPILKPLNNIQHMDAILAYDAAGMPAEPVWPAAEVIVGNPPFLGDKRMKGELGPEYVDQIREMYQGRVLGGADLVTYWFERSRSQIEADQAQRAGLISTNSIRFGSSRAVLDRIKATGNIFVAWSDRAWILDGADVRVSIVGFDNGSERVLYLDGRQVQTINADLTSSVDITGAVQLPENAGLSFLGMMKGGPFDIDNETAALMLKAPANKHERPNSDVVKQRLGGQDITGRYRGGWIIDFVEMSLEEASLYQVPFEYVVRVIKPIRDKSNDSRMRQKWWLHGRSRPALRSAISGMQRCIVTPEVAKHRIFIWMDTATIPDHTCHVIARDDDYIFGLLHSRIHEIWSLAIGNYMGVGNDPRYNSSRTFETFPFPWSPGHEMHDDPRVQAIAAAAQALVAQRDAWLHPSGLTEAVLKQRTLTHLYNARPAWLDAAHTQLDAAVLDAYGWPHDLSDEEMLTRLLALNLARAQRQ